MRKVLMMVALISSYALQSCSSKSDENPYSGYPPMTDSEDVCTSMDDINFICYENFDVNGDGKVSLSEANGIIEMWVPSKESIRSIKEYSTLQTYPQYMSMQM